MRKFNVRWWKLIPSPMTEIYLYEEAADHNYTYLRGMMAGLHYYDSSASKIIK